MALLDTIVGGVASISSTGGTVTLNAAQAQCGTIQVSGALASDLTILFPAVQGWWTVFNVTSNNNSFVVNLGPTGGSQTICAPPGELIDIQMDVSIPRYRNLGRVGSLLELATPSIPLWITRCSVPPYLNCDGTTFSAGTYPQLSVLLGGTTLPDSRGRVRATLNQGTSRLTAAGSGINGDANESGGGAQTQTLITANLPPYTPSGSVSSSSSNAGVGGFGTNGGSILVFNLSGGSSALLVTSSFSGNAQGGTSTPIVTVQPTYVAGYTLIRAA